MPLKLLSRCAYLACAAVICACSGSHATSAAVPVTNAKRIVALMPSFAQDLCAMGDAGRIVAVSQYAKSASCAAGAPEVANFASVNAEKIISLHPDVIVAIPAQRRLLAPLQRAGIPAVFLPDESYADIFSSIAALGNVSGDTVGAERLQSQLRARTKALQAAAHLRKHPRIFVVLQAQPIWTVGPQSYISTLLTLAGARNAVTSLPQAYAQYTAEALLQLRPDAIVAGSDTQLTSILNREPWRSLQAVRSGHVFILADPSVLERPGPNYNEGLSWLIDHLRPLTR